MYREGVLVGRYDENNANAITSTIRPCRKDLRTVCAENFNRIMSLVLLPI